MMGCGLKAIFPPRTPLNLNHFMGDSPQDVVVEGVEDMSTLREAVR